MELVPRGFLVGEMHGPLDVGSAGVQLLYNLVLAIKRINTEPRCLPLYTILSISEAASGMRRAPGNFGANKILVRAVSQTCNSDSGVNHAPYNFFKFMCHGLTPFTFLFAAPAI